jgi:hypothetical protein
MATKIEVRKRGEEDIIDKTVPGEVHPAQRIFWKDEAGSLYSQLGKQHMKGLIDTMDDFFGCPDYRSYPLSAETYHIEDIYFPMIVATTPNDFVKNMASSDVRTGFLPRHQFVIPSYVNPYWKGGRGPIKEDTDIDDKRTKALIHALKIIDMLLADGNIKISFEEGVLVKNGDSYEGIVNLWSGAREEYFKNRKHALDSYFSKYQTAAIKFAALIELGNLPYIIATMGEEAYKQGETIKTISLDGIPSLDEILDKILAVDIEKLKNIKIAKLVVTKESFIYAARLFDTVYIPYANLLTGELREANGSQQNITEKVFTVMQESRVITYGDLVRKVRPTNRQALLDVLEVMQDSGSLEIIKITGKTKPAIAYVYISQDHETFVHLPFSGCSFPINGYKTYICLTDNIDPQFKANIISMAQYMLNFIEENKIKNTNSLSYIANQIEEGDQNLKFSILQELKKHGNIIEGEEKYEVVSKEIPLDFCSYEIYEKYLSERKEQEGIEQKERSFKNTVQCEFAYWKKK